MAPSVSKTAGDFDPNSELQLSLWDLCFTFIALTVYAPWSVLTALYRKRKFLRWKDTPGYIHHGLMMGLARHLPISILQQAMNRKDDIPWKSPRYAHVPSPLKRKVQTSEFTAYWITDTRPEDADIVLFHLHGGGYVLGHPFENATEMLLIAEVLAKCNKAMAILSLDYSLAPKAPFPTQLKQALAAYTWLLNDQRIDPANLYLIGESAGGHLILSLLVTLHHQSLSPQSNTTTSPPKPGAALLISPWLNLNPIGRPRRHSDALTQALNEATPQDAAFREVIDRFSRAVLRDTPIECRALYGNFAAVVAQRGSWRDILPPKTWVSAGTAEPIFRAEMERFVDCARSDGVEEVVYEVTEGGEHVWQSVEAREHEKQFLAMPMGEDNLELMPGYRHVAWVITSWLDMDEEGKW